MAQPSADIIDACVALAEGHFDPAGWLQWWETHAAEVERSVAPGWFLRLKPRGFGGASINGVLLNSQLGACYLLDQLNIPYARSSRYEEAAQRERDSYHAAQLAAQNDPAKEQEVTALAERFRKLGARNAEEWAQSEVHENIPQLARFVFLRELWKLVVSRTNVRALNRFNAPHDDGNGGPFRRIKERGVALADVLAIVREAQSEVIRDVAHLLDQVSELDQDVQDVAWGLFELDAECRPIRAMDGLHESVDDEDVKPRKS